MADQYWRTPKKIDNRSAPHMPRGHWYASPRGSIEIYTPSGVPIGKINAAALREFLNMLDRHNPRNAVPDLHPEVLKMIEAGPQRPTPCPLCKGSAVRVSRGFTGKEATHWCSACKGTGGIEETPQEFARRIAALAVEKEREECAKVCEKHEEDWHDTDWEGGCMDAASVLAAAIRRRGKP